MRGSTLTSELLHLSSLSAHADCIGVADMISRSLQYQNRKAEYFNAIWDVINWKTAEKRFDAAK